MGKIRWTQEAANWLKDIHAYIAQDNPVAAGRVVRGIYDRIQILDRFPEMGYRYDIVPEGDIRILVHGHYRIAYLARPNKVIEILGVFHGALDINRYLGNR